MSELVLSHCGISGFYHLFIRLTPKSNLKNQKKIYIPGIVKLFRPVSGCIINLFHTFAAAKQYTLLREV